MACDSQIILSFYDLYKTSLLVGCLLTFGDDDPGVPMTHPAAGPSRPNLKTSLAEGLADHLRERIVSGELPDGAMLPRQDDFAEEFGISKPSVRHALRILEAEGLVAVQRGKHGGAVVMAPNSNSAAYSLGLVLQNQVVTLGDLAAALQELEPVCAQLCARREDRRQSLIPNLRQVLSDTLEAIDDEKRAIECSRRFHDLIIKGCANRTLILSIRALNSVWLAHQPDWGGDLVGRFDADRRREGLDHHARIVDAIDSGDDRQAYDEMATHVYADMYQLFNPAARTQPVHRHVTSRDNAEPADPEGDANP